MRSGGIAHNFWGLIGSIVAAVLPTTREIFEPTVLLFGTTPRAYGDGPNHPLIENRQPSGSEHNAIFASSEPAARSELPSVPRCKGKRYDCQGRHQAKLYIGQAVEFVMALHNHEGDLLSECHSFITMPLKYAHDSQKIIDLNQKRELKSAEAWSVR
jgi:hypothetical protein